MDRFFTKAIFLVTLAFLHNCSNKDANNVNLSLLSGSVPVYYLDGEVDTDLVPNCGTATPVTSSTSTTTGTGTSTTTASNTVFTIYSPLILKTTKDNLNIRFTFNYYQTQGAIDPQQGFVLTGGSFGNTVTGNQGTVKWPGFVGTINQSCTSKQALQYFGLEISLSGYYIPGSSSSVTPQTCNTADNINCTSSSTTNTCYTQDNKTCLVVNTSGTPILIQGKINCNHPNVISNCS